jgi:hypothetical protein
VAFLLGVTVTMVGPISRIIGPKGRIDHSQFRSEAATVFGFVIAFYLIIISIIATQVFDQQLSHPDEPGTRLTKLLAEMSATVPQSLNNTARPINQNFEEITSWLEDLKKVNPQEAVIIDNIIGDLKDYYNTLETLPKAFTPRQEEEIKSIQEMLEEQNHHLFGVAYAESYVDDLLQFYRSWVSASISAAKRCRSAITTEQAEFSVFVEKVKEAFQTDPLGKAAFPTWDSQLALSQECDFDAAVADLQIPPSHTVIQSFGPIFGPLAGWLIVTESRELTLITGLVGFGIFGALSASFIRPNLKRETVSAFVRGISAAILVYLVVVGGLAVFTRGTAPPNPYAVFFACFVASVFSEDVWNWARQGQQRTLDGAAAPKAKDQANPTPT